MKTTTMKIDAARREILKDASFKISMEAKEIISMSDIVKFMIDKYSDQATEEMISEFRQRNNA